jgi:hypothetical protein
VHRLSVGLAVYRHGLHAQTLAGSRKRISETN